MPEIVEFIGADGQPVRMEIPDGLSDAEALEFFAQSQDVRQVPQSAEERLGRSILEGEQAAQGFGEGLLQVGVGAAASRIPGGLLIQSGIQGAIASAFELARQVTGGGEVSGQDIAQQGALGAVGGPAMRAAGQVGSAVRRVSSARRAGAPITFPEENIGTGTQTLAQTMRGGGGLSGATLHNSRLVNERVARAIGVPEEMIPAARRAGFTEEMLSAGRGTINAQYQAAAPTELVAVGRFKELLREMVEVHQLPEADLTKILNRIGDRTTIDPGTWQGIQRTMRDIRSSIGRNPVFSGQRGLVDDAIDLLDEQAVISGGNKALLSEANQRFKVLATVEEINSVLESGQVPANELVRKLARDNFKGFGRRTIAEGADENLIPAVQSLIDVAKGAAQLNRAITPGAQTAGRALTFGAPAAGVASLLTGATGPGGAAVLGLGGFGAARLAAFSTLGNFSADPAGRAIIGAGAQALPSVFNQANSDQ